MIRQIKFHTGSLVDGIQITYRLSNGHDYAAPHHSGYGGGQHNRHLIDVNVDGGERIIGIFGRVASLVDQIGFVTNHGRIFGPYGGCGGDPFTAIFVEFLEGLDR